MNIAQIVAGSGDTFYCDNCLRDTALVRALRRLGHDVLMIPMYLPILADRDVPVSDTPIFFGGINVYLQQKSALFRKTPRWIDRLFDAPGLLKWVGRKAHMTSARSLGETTISMLRGEEGRQLKELERLAAWLDKRDVKPDVVCLSNILLTGLARRIKQRLGVPVVCLLQDEDAFLDGLTTPYAGQAWEILAQRACDVDAFISVSEYYGDVMRRRLKLPSERVHVAYMGISPEGYEAPPEASKVPTIGYLSRMCFDKGLDILADAFVILKKNEKLNNTRLRVAGGKTGNDDEFIDRIRQRLNRSGVMGHVEFLPDFAHDARIAFLRTLSVLSVPEKKPIAGGLYVLEALAAGVPVVEPSMGAFPELLEMTGGGILCEPNNAEALAAAMEPLLLDSAYARRLGKQGRDGVFEKFTIEHTTRHLVRIYEEVVRLSK